VARGEREHGHYGTDQQDRLHAQRRAVLVLLAPRGAPAAIERPGDDEADDEAARVRGVVDGDEDAEQQHHRRPAQHRVAELAAARSPDEVPDDRSRADQARDRPRRARRSDRMHPVPRQRRRRPAQPAQQIQRHEPRAPEVRLQHHAHLVQRDHVHPEVRRRDVHEDGRHDAPPLAVAHQRRVERAELEQRVRRETAPLRAPTGGEHHRVDEAVQRDQEVRRLHAPKPILMTAFTHVLC